MLLLQQMIVLFIYIALGYGAAKKGVMDDTFSKKISWVVVNIANPALTLSAVVNGDGTIEGKELLLTTAVALVILGGMVLLSLAMPFLFRVRKEHRGVYRLMSAFNNIGFMGFPVIVAVYGQEALLYAAIFSMLFNVLIYTYGIQTVQKEARGIEWGKVFNIGVLGSILAIVIYLLRIPTPEFFNTTMSGLSGLTAPLSMMVIGISLTSIRLKELFLDTRLLLYSLFKLLAVPILALQVIIRVIDNEMLCGVCMVMLATPAASMTAMLSQQYGDEESAEQAAKGVALTTLLSVVTIPIVSAVVFT
ncbi:MAG: AEC family transporter [Dorea sp.]|jgi:predicted permease|nr:AEC family transporter [Dorea sp.]